MTITFYSTEDTVDQVITDIQAKCRVEMDAKAVVFFASVKYPQDVLSKALKSLFPQAAVFGCSTAGEIISGKMGQGGVAGMVIGADMIEDIHIEVIENLEERSGTQNAFHHFEDYFSTPLNKIDIEKYAGIVLIDGMSGAEERLLQWIGDLCDLSFIGGSAGDDLQFKKTYIHADGKVYSGAALLALIKTRNGFDVIKTQSFQVLPQKLIASEVDEKKRMALKFNEKPARIAYSEAVGATPEKAGELFMLNPIGLMVGSEPYVRSPQHFEGDKMVFFCNIKTGVEYQLLQSRDIVEDTKKVLREKGWVEGGEIACILDFDCILRRQSLESDHKTQAYANLFNDIPTVGFSTYGEAYIGHINQTASMLGLKKA